MEHIHLLKVLVAQVLEVMVEITLQQLRHLVQQIQVQEEVVVQDIAEIKHQEVVPLVS